LLEVVAEQEILVILAELKDLAVVQEVHMLVEETQLLIQVVVGIQLL
jgi:hypothetical protein